MRVELYGHDVKAKILDLDFSPRVSVDSLVTAGDLSVREMDDISGVSMEVCKHLWKFSRINLTNDNSKVLALSKSNKWVLCQGFPGKFPQNFPKT